MSEMVQIQKVNKSTTDTSVPNSSKLLDKNRKPLVSQPPLFQAKLAINQPGDKYEQEADRVAEQVMRMQDPILQRKCAKCDEDEEKVLQAKESPEKIPVTQDQDVPPIVHEVLRSPGQSLNPETRSFMEQRFGHDFSRVRVHSGVAAEQSAWEVNANAYTVGHNVVFGVGQFAPGTNEGRQLIAHELTHVVQQSDSDGILDGQSKEGRDLHPISLRDECSRKIPAPQGREFLRSQAKLTMSHLGDEFEREADRVTQDVVSGRSIAMQQHRTIPPTVQRQEAPEKPREQPTQFPAQEFPKRGKEWEDEFKEKLKTGGLKAAGELAKFLWDGFSNSVEGKRILADNEHDWKPILEFFEDFSATIFGKTVLVAATSGSMAGLVALSWSDRETSDDSDISSSTGGLKQRAPKDEKFFNLELKWDFVSPPTGVTLKTPWLDLPEIPIGPKKPTSTPALSAPPVLFNMVQKIPRICTPADPQGDQGEADARSAFIFLWLQRNRQVAEKRMQELLDNSKLLESPPKIEPFKIEPFAVKPLFKLARDTEAIPDPQAIEVGLSSPGQFLDSETCALMESRLGHDFSHVRVHTDPKAAESAQAMNALAYTVGREVVFGDGQYMLGTCEGKRLLAHELVHVMQQTGAYRPVYFSTFDPSQRDSSAISPSFSSIIIGSSSDAAEQEADQIANQVVDSNSADIPFTKIHDSAPILRAQESQAPAQTPQQLSEIRLNQLATRPSLALRQWQTLSQDDRDQIQWSMMLTYGQPFVIEFLKYAKGLKKPRLGLAGVLKGPEYTPKWLFDRGYRHAYGELWVHPSGEELMVLEPSSGPVTGPEGPDVEKKCPTRECFEDTEDEEECKECCEAKFPEEGSDCRRYCDARCNDKI